MAVDEQDYYYEWEGLGEKWITTEESFDSDFPSQPYFDDEGRIDKPVSTWIIEDIFNLTLRGDFSNIGSKLPGYDVKSRDAYEMIRLSLAAEMGGNFPRFYECYADEKGEVGFYSIGINDSNIESDILYSINSGEVKLKCDNVIVLGYDPPPKKYTGKEYNLFTFAKDKQNILKDYESTPIPDADPYDEEVDNFVPDPYLFVDTERDLYPKFNIFGDILGPEQCNYFVEGFIEYGDPMFSNMEAMKEIGVYDYTKYESVVGYIYKIDVDFYEEGMTDVQFSTKTTRFEGLNGFGELQTRKAVSNDIYRSSLCQEVTDRIYPDPIIGEELPNSKNRKFLGVKDIYVYGYKVKLRPCEILEEQGTPKEPKPVWVKDPNCEFWASMDTMSCEPFRLTRNEDYVIVKNKETDGESHQETSGYKIVFSCNVDDYWRGRFGKELKLIPPYGCRFRIDPVCILGKYEKEDGKYEYKPASYKIYGDNTFYADGWLKDGETYVNSNQIEPVTIFPTAEGNTGYVVEKLIAVYDWNNPCVVVKDQRPDKVTLKNLKDHVSVKFYPIIIKDIPAPEALNGELLDPTEVMPDYDPTTTQNLEETPYARAFSSLESGDIKVTMPFADGDDCIKISNLIKSIQTDIAEEIVYICDPGADPVLGEKYGDGVINAIDYSYQDSSQYLISVHTGPLWRGVGGWDNSIYKMKTENPQLEGKVVQVSRDGVKCRVFIKRIGLMECINGTRHKLEKGDFVNVTIYNNPVSL